MANKTISMTKIKQYIRLKQQGCSQRKISSMLVVHRDTIRKYDQQLELSGISIEDLLKYDEQALERLFDNKAPPPSPDRLAKLNEFFPYVDRELGRVGVDRYNLWMEYKQTEPAGYTYSHFCREYKRWKATSEVSAHFEHVAGDKMFVDFTGSKLYITDPRSGEKKEVEVFVAILGYSHYTYVEATVSQKKEDFIGAVENALHYFGGVPKAIVTDNLKSAVTQSSKYEPQLNDTFENFALHYSTTILPTRAYKPKDKAIVEGAVKIVYKRIFAPLRNGVFHSLPDLNQAIRQLLEHHNTQPFKGKDSSRKTIFTHNEKETLGQLSAQRYELRNYNWINVQKSSHVYMSADKHFYSVPYKYLGHKVKLVYTNTTVEIYHNLDRIATHLRDRQPYKYTTASDHMPSTHSFVNEWSADRFINWAGGIGKFTKLFVEKVLETKAYPEQAYKACMGLLSFAKKVGSQRLDNACERALHYQSYSYQTIKKILEQGLDREPAQLEIPYNIPSHENIRGEGYYN